MNQQEEQQRAKKLMQNLDEIGSPPPRRRKLYRSATIGFVILVVLGIVLLIWNRTADAPGTGTQKGYPDGNGSFRQPKSGQ